jgi:molecular chaperone GrpE (heat shock protein)
MGLSDLFNGSQEPKCIDLLEVFYESANSFIHNNKRNIIKEGEDGNTYVVLSKPYLSELLKYINKDVSKATNAFIKQNFSSSKDQIINTDLKLILDQMSSDVKRIDKNIVTGTTYEKSGSKLFILPKISQRQEDTLNAVDQILSELQNIISKQEESIRDQSKIIENQHNSILRYENDVLFKSKKELLMELIGIADQIKYTIDDQSVNKDYGSLLDAVKALGEWVNGSLQTETVRKYEKTKLNNTILDTKTQEVVEVEMTSNIDEDGKYKTLLPGYFWTMPLVGSSAVQNIQSGPRSFEFVLRPEQVIQLKFKPEHVETKLTDKEAVLVEKDNPQEKKIDIVDSNKITNVEGRLTLKNDYGKEKNDQVLLREDECDSSKDSLKDKISNGQAMQLGHLSGLHFEDQVSSFTDNKRFKGKSRKQ